MEDGLGEAVDKRWRACTTEVLILVLVEDGLGVGQFASEDAAREWGLNPCFSGGWSRRIDWRVDCAKRPNRS